MVLPIRPRGVAFDLASSPAGLDNPNVQPPIGQGTWTEVQGPLFGPGGPAARDVAQGEDGDCYFLAALAELANRDPQIIRKAIQDKGDGTYVVTFHDGQQLVKVAIDRKLPMKDGHLVNASRARSDALWPELIEKAFAKWKGGYPAIGRGGFGGPAIAALTGWTPHAEALADQSPEPLFERIQATLAAGGVVLAGTPAQRRPDAPPGLVEDHEWSILKAERRPDGLWLQVRNPWGTGNFHGGQNGVFWIRTMGLINEFSGIVFARP
jgi:hypothetical protein